MRPFAPGGRLRGAGLIRHLLHAVLLLGLVGGLCWFHFSRNFVSGRLTPEAMDQVQAARFWAGTGNIATGVVRPLDTASVRANANGTLPNFRHPPLYTGLLAAVQRLTRETGAGRGDRAAALLGITLLALAIGASALLGGRLVSSSPSRLALVLASLFFAFGSGAPLSFALQPRPELLAALLMALLLWALFALDTFSTAEGTAPSPPRWRVMSWAGLSGLLYGLLGLSLYSALVLAPFLLWHLWRVTRRNVAAIVVFTLAALLVTTPLLLRAWRLTGNPLYHARLVELVMHTNTYPGNTLYRQPDLLRPIPAYLAAGGVGDVLGKAGRGLRGVYETAPRYLGLLVIPLFFGAALTRFTDGRVNRTRNLVYIFLGVHMLSLTLFVPAAEAGSVLVVYAPWAAALSGFFLLSLVRARNLPVFLARTAITGWGACACLPGVMALWVYGRDTEETAAPPYIVYSELWASPRMRTLRTAAGGLLLSDAPREVVFWVNYPAVYLPPDAAAVERIEQRVGMDVACVVLTPDVNRRTENTNLGASPWPATYNAIVSLAQVARKMEAPLRKTVVERTTLFYPPEISPVMETFRPLPQIERGGTEMSLVFWREQQPQ